MLISLFVICLEFGVWILGFRIRAMADTLVNRPVKMIRLSLKDVPQHPMPPGYIMRLYEPGDEATWVAIQSLADKINRITPETFQREY